MPAILAEYFPQISSESVQEVMENYKPAWDIVRHTWSHETMQELLQGKVTVPDSMINEAIAEQLEREAMRGLETSDEAEQSAEMSGEAAEEQAASLEELKKARLAELPVSELKLTSKANGRLEIFAQTKKLGRLEFSGTIEEFVHNTEDSHVTYRVKERALKDHGLASWFFSRISLSMAQQLFGKFELGESLPTQIKGNYITLDCKQALENSELAEAEYMGHRFLDMVEIKNAVPHDGYIQLETSLNIPQEIQVALLDMILRRR